MLAADGLIFLSLSLSLSSCCLLFPIPLGLLLLPPSWLVAEPREPQTISDRFTTPSAVF